MDLIGYIPIILKEKEQTISHERGAIKISMLQKLYSILYYVSDMWLWYSPKYSTNW